MDALLNEDWLEWFLIAALPLHLLVCGLSLLSLRNREFAHLARLAAFPLLLSVFWVSLVSMYTLLIGLGIWTLRDYRAELAGRGIPIAVAVFTGTCALLQIAYWSELPDFLWSIIDATEPFDLY